MFSRKKTQHSDGSSGSLARQNPGLVNNSASCYLNSTIQALAASDFLHSALPHDELLASGTAHTPTTAQPSLSLQRLSESHYPPDVPIAANFATVLRKIWSVTDSTTASKRLRPVNPSNLHRTLASKNSEYDGDSQQDAHEFLLYLLEEMRLEELDLIKKINPPQPAAQKASVSQSVDSGDSSSEDEAHPVSSAPKTFVDSMFTGQLAQFIVCEHCKHVSVAHEPFTDLSVALAGGPDKSDRRRNRIKKFLTSNFTPPDNSSKSSPESGSHGNKPVRPNGRSRGPSFLSQSDTEASESDDAESRDGMEATIGADERVKRRRSLDPASLRKHKSIWSHPTTTMTSLSRDPSPSRTPTGYSSGSETGSNISRSSSTKPKKLNKEETEYVKAVLAHIPTSSFRSPLDLLRIASPNHPGGHKHGSPTEPASADHPGQSAVEAQMSTGLYQALCQFAEVEILEGENAFHCHKCWKLANPRPAHKARLGRSRRNTGASSKTIKASHQADPAIDPSPASVGPVIEITPTTPYEDSEAPSFLSATSSASEADSATETDADSEATSDNHTTVSEDSRRLASSHAPSRPHSPAVKFASTTLQSTVPKSEQYITRRARKRYLIETLPSVLFVHFNRFQQTSRSSFLTGSASFNSLKKIDDYTSFPLDLDLQPFLAPSGKPSKSGRTKIISRKAGHQEQYTKYQLKAVVVHTGSMSSGHYVSFVRCGHASPIHRSKSDPDTTVDASLSKATTDNLNIGSVSAPASLATSPQQSSDNLSAAEAGSSSSQWLYCSDEEVRSASVNEVLRCKAYILLYERM